MNTLIEEQYFVDPTVFSEVFQPVIDQERIIDEISFDDFISATIQK